MEKKQNPLKHIKFEVRQAPNSLKLALVLLMVFSMAALTALRWVHLELQAETSALLSEAAVLEYETDELDRKINALGSVQSIEEIAQNELDLVDPDTILIDPS